MVIRPATASDLAAAFELVMDMYARSKYASDAEVDAPTARSLLMQALQRHGGQNNGSTHFVVAEGEGRLDGFMIGALQRIYLIGNRLEAQDMFLYTRKDANPRAALGMLNSYIEWAESCQKVGTIKLSYTDALAVDGERLAALYERKGFQRHGAMFERVMPV
ncbi:hypothetical protein [Sphingobium yanoikuyae]|uniref:hypothetical protein n=1 Tax=Sphingobium yanoikuyae TaxID=13690 RepID=UPI0035C70805